MSKQSEVYKCNDCDFTVEVLTDGCHAQKCCDSLECCGKPMELLEEKTADAAAEKHVPILEEKGEGIKVIVGSTLHPMDEDHFIEWIEVVNGDYKNRKYLKPGDSPNAEFYVPNQKGLILRSYCNQHGLWRG